MDNLGRLLSCGVPGEIVIAGRGVSRGYVNRPEETAQRYRLDPFVDGDRCIAPATAAVCSPTAACST